MAEKFGILGYTRNALLGGAGGALKLGLIGLAGGLAIGAAIAGIAVLVPAGAAAAMVGSGGAALFIGAAAMKGLTTLAIGGALLGGGGAIVQTFQANRQIDAATLANPVPAAQAQSASKSPAPAPALAAAPAPAVTKVGRSAAAHAAEGSRNFTLLNVAPETHIAPEAHVAPEAHAHVSPTLNATIGNTGRSFVERVTRQEQPQQQGTLEAEPAFVR